MGRMILWKLIFADNLGRICYKFDKKNWEYNLIEVNFAQNYSN